MNQSNYGSWSLWGKLEEFPHIRVLAEEGSVWGGGGERHEERDEGQSALPAASSSLSPPRTQKSSSRRVKKETSVKNQVKVKGN